MPGLKQPPDETVASPLLEGFEKCCIEAGSTLGQWDGTGQCNSLLRSGGRLMGNQNLLMGYKSGRTHRAFISPVCSLHF